MRGCTDALITSGNRKVLRIGCAGSVESGDKALHHMREYQAILKRENVLREVYAIDFLHLKVMVCISGSYEWHEYKVLRRSIGYDDKDGRQIYEGDIVKGKHKNGVVEYFPSLGWEGGGSEHPGFYCKAWFEGDDLDYSNGFYQCEVIGNIYEDPELMK